MKNGAIICKVTILEAAPCSAEEITCEMVQNQLKIQREVSLLLHFLKTETCLRLHVKSQSNLYDLNEN